MINYNQEMIKKINQIRMSNLDALLSRLQACFLDLSFCEVSSHMHATLQAMSDGPLVCPLESKNEAVSNNSVSACHWTGPDAVYCLFYIVY